MLIERVKMVDSYGLICTCSWETVILAFYCNYIVDKTTILFTTLFS